MTLIKGSLCTQNTQKTRRMSFCESATISGICVLKRSTLSLLLWVMSRRNAPLSMGGANQARLFQR